MTGVHWLGNYMRPGEKAEITALEWHALEWISINMREADAREIYGNLPTENPLEVARSVMHKTAQDGVGYLCWLNGRPVSALGAFKMWDGVYQIWSYGTNDYSRSIVYIPPKLGDLVAWLLENRCHRLQCASHVEHTKAHRLLRALGARQETVLHGYGKDGSDYILYVWLRPDLETLLARIKPDA